MIDLQKFCEKEAVDGIRGECRTPYSRGEFTIATNGKILVRVARRDDIPENERAPNPEEPYSKIDPNAAEHEIPLSIPEDQYEDCQWCTIDEEIYGKGKCFECGGTGKIQIPVPVRVGPASFDARYLRLIAELPNVKFYPSACGDDRWHIPPSRFTFDGGDGCVMPMSVKD